MQKLNLVRRINGVEIRKIIEDIENEMNFSSETYDSSFYPYQTVYPKRQKNYKR